MAEGTWEKILTHRRGKVPLSGRARGGGVDCHRKLPELGCVHGPMGSQWVGWLWHRLQRREASCSFRGYWMLLVQVISGQALVWAKSIGG